MYSESWLFYISICPQVGPALHLTLLLHLQRGHHPPRPSLQEGQGLQILQSYLPQSDSDRLCHNVQVGHFSSLCSVCTSERTAENSLIFNFIWWEIYKSFPGRNYEWFHTLPIKVQLYILTFQKYNFSFPPNLQVSWVTFITFISSTKDLLNSCL